MDRLGFIRERLDIKILILFILGRVPGELSPAELNELCQCDEGIDYFDYSDCLAELVKSGHITETKTGYLITEKGRRNAETVESSLPYSVRRKAEKLIAPVAERLRRDALICTKHKMTDKGCIVTLSMSDGVGNIIDLDILCAGEEQAEAMEKNFRRDAELYYGKFVELLTEKI